MENTVSLTKTVCVLVAVAMPAIACAPRPEPPVAELRARGAEGPLVFASSTRVPVEWNLLRQVPDASPMLFVHLHDSGREPLQTFDRVMPGDSAEIDSLEIWQSALATPLPAGSYRLTSGLYDLATGQRWSLDTGGNEIRDGEYEIAVIEVESPERKTPALVFEGDWHAPEEAQLHNPGRRWLGEAGSIRLSGNTGWSEMVLSLSMTALPADQHRPVFNDDTGAPELVIRNGCDGAEDSGSADGRSTRDGSAGDGSEDDGSEDDGFADAGSEIRIDGYGVHSVTLRLAAGDCAISFEPNFFMLGLEDFVRRSVGLESAFFRPTSRQGN